MRSRRPYNGSQDDGRATCETADGPEPLPPLRRVTDLRTGAVFGQRSWEFERLRAEILYAPMNGTVRSWIRRVWFRVSWRWNRAPWVQWSADRAAEGSRGSRQIH